MARALSKEQLSQLQELLKGFNVRQVCEIFFGLEQGVDVSIYANTKYNHEQMCQLRRGLINGVDVSVYADPRFCSRQMCLIKNCLEDGRDVSACVEPEIGWIKTKQIREPIEQAATND
ncbi:MAG: hypothetical protein E6Z25_00295 [Negativicoccus succinicivorans]|uniref:hypothetical protein n=1 Tax=Negativicoccus succinicivorans TaxID=620903 RepID=UPI00290AE318|nr:hypothetical protein [Negativicoccus succinicivorans]MDU5914501.1 hypothetical protein [Negativicoccus succinicivorans]